MFKQFLLFVACIIGFLIILYATRKEKRNSRSYVCKMILFMIFQGILMILVFIHFVDGIEMRYGDEFNRKIYAYDRNRDEYSYVLNDDSVKITNGEIEGGYAPDKAAYAKHFITIDLHGRPPSDFELRLEPNTIYYMRTFFLFLSVGF